MSNLGTFQSRDITFSFRLKEGGGFEISGHRASAVITNGATGFSTASQIVIEGLSQDKMNRLSYATGLVSSTNSNTKDISDDWVGIKIKNAVGGIQTIFSGQITDGITDYNSAPDPTLTLMASNVAGVSLMATKPLSYKGNITASEILSDIANGAGFNGFVDHGIKGDFRNYYCHGSPTDMIRRVVDACQGSFRIDNTNGENILHAWGRKYENLKQEITVIPKASLKGFPSASAYGIKCTCLFNPAIIYYGNVVIESDFLPSQWTAVNGTENASGQTIGLTKAPWDGSWRVIRVTHFISSKTPNGSWFTEFEAQRPQGMENNVAVHN